MFSHKDDFIVEEEAAMLCVGLCHLVFSVFTSAGANMSLLNEL